jgi:hypothetical protein
MTMPDLEAIAALLANGDSLDAAIRALQPDDRTELLKRCSAVHEFDAELLHVLRSAPPALASSPLDDLVRSGVVEAVPGRDGTYRLPALDRQEHYATWWGDEGVEVIPRELRDLSELVLPCLDPDGVEAVYHLLIVDPAEGLKQFAAEFEAADERVDLARCQDLLDVVVERLALLGPEGAAVCNRYKCRLRSRSMWMRDWRSSSRFLLPAPSAAATEDLLADDGARTLSLWSDGGMGKSSYVRWLISRRCVPEGHACALIDFDRIDPLRACQEPWLLLLEAAHQLDQQLTDAPFHELLADHPRQRERLSPRASTSSNLGAAAGAAVRERFGAILAELDSAQRVMIVLDTLEVALLLGGAARDQSDMLPMLEQLADLLAVAPVLRVVLTARHDLSEAVSGSGRLFSAGLSVPLEKFTDGEAHRYLTRYRGITRSELIVRIVQSAAGVPFKLALIADVAEQHPDLDPAELDAYVNADMAYVMEKIVRRLDPSLRTFLLYGVAPRTLERGFADEVIAPLLGAAGGGDLLWRGLKRYAGRASWVALDPEDVDAVRFHPSILEPMRELLRNTAAHDELQRRAAEWYERRAADEPANATRLLCEAVYHRFQLEGPPAVRHWRRMLRDARAEHRPDRRRALAAELLGGDYVTGCQPRPWRDGQPLLAPEALVRARWELAFAAIQLAHPDAPERRPGQALEAQRALKDLEHLRSSTEGVPLPKGEVALVRAGLQLVNGDLDAAKPHIEIALRGHLAREDRLWLWLAYAAAGSARGERQAGAHYRTALRIAERGPEPDVAISAVFLQLALHHADHDHIDKALDACQAGAARASGRQAVELALTRAQLELRRGAPSAALDALAGAADDESDVLARREIEHTRALLAAGHPIDALAAAERAAARYGAVLQGAGDREWTIAAHGRELRGKVRAALLDVEGAVADFEEAAARWSRLGSTDGVCRSWVRGAALHLRGLGNLHEAGVRLDQARRARASRGGDAWTRCTLLGADLLFRNGDPERAAKLVTNAIDALHRANRPPRAFIAAALQGLAVSEGPAQDPFVGQLCAQLSRVTPPTARLPLLDGIERCGPLSGSPALRKRLRRLVPSPMRAATRYAELAPRDVALLALRDAELDRIVGRADRACASLEGAWRALTPDPPRAVVHALIGAAARAGARSLLYELAQRELSVIVPGVDPAPVLDGAALVQGATAIPDPVLRSTLLELANELFVDQGAAAGAWPARLLELRARDREAADPEARDLMRRAGELYEALGDEAGRRRASGAPESGPRGPSTPAGAHELRATVRLRDGELTIVTQRHDGRTGRLHNVDGGARVHAMLTARTAAEAAGRLLHDRNGLARELAALLRDAAATVAPAASTLDMGLRAKETIIRALPWELAGPALAADGLRLFRRSPRTRGEPTDIRGIQGALNRLGRLRLAPDGDLGPETRAALAEFQSTVGLPDTGQPDPVTVQRLHGAIAGGAKPVVAIVRPSRGAEDRAFRGSRQSGVPVEWAYERLGFRTLVLDSPTGAELAAVLHKRPVAILHVNAGLVDHHGTPAIDLLAVAGSKGGPAGSGRHTGTALDGVIPRNLPAPLVVLDVTAPRSRHEAAAQLLLRNAFAAELAGVGTVRAVVATGLARYHRQERLYDALIGALRDGRTVHDVTEAVRALAGEAHEPTLEDAFAFTATALFARTPSVRFPAPR